MKTDWLVFLAYYLYAAVLIIATGYVVFVLDYSGAWFILTVLFCCATPSITSKNNKE